MANSLNIFTQKYKSFYEESVSKINSIIDAFRNEYEVTKNQDAKMYVDELNSALNEINSAVSNNKEFSLEEEKFLINYIDEVINKYFDLYHTMLARESLKRYASQDENTFDEIPLWENTDNNQLLGFNNSDYNENNEKESEK